MHLDEPVAPSPTSGTSVPATSAAPTPTARPRHPSNQPGGTVASVADVVTGLDVPWGLAFLPGGRAVVTLRDAAQLILVDGYGAVTPVTGPGADQLRRVVRPDGEAGLLGVAVLDVVRRPSTSRSTPRPPTTTACCAARCRATSSAT